MSLLDVHGHLDWGPSICFDQLLQKRPTTFKKQGSRVANIRFWLKHSIQMSASSWEVLIQHERKIFFMSQNDTNFCYIRLLLAICILPFLFHWFFFRSAEKLWNFPNFNKIYNFFLLGNLLICRTNFWSHCTVGD